MHNAKCTMHNEGGSETGRFFLDQFDLTNTLSAFHIENGKILLGERLPIFGSAPETICRETIGMIGISSAIIDWI